MKRVCPVCLKLSPDNAARCECGYTFDTGADNTTTTNSATVEVVRNAVAEGEYEKFYELRLQQAQQDLKTLIERYGKSGWTPVQRHEIVEAIKLVEEAKADLEAQHRRTDDAQKHLQQAKTRVELRQISALANKKI